MATAIHTTPSRRHTGAGRALRLRRRGHAIPDARLVAELRDGRVEAFEAIYDRYASQMLAFCRHMLGSSAEAEDAVQETFASAYRSLLRDRRELELRPWLYAIARNRCISVLRTRRPAGELPELRDEHDSLPEQVARREDLRTLVDDVRRLPEDQRAALLLAELADMPHRDLAQALDCRPEKVKALVFQARSALLADREARAVACHDVRTAIAADDMGGSGRIAYRRHLRMCSGCGDFADSIKRQKTLLAVALPVVPGVALKARTLAVALGGLHGGASTAGTTAGTSTAGAALAGVGKGLVAKGLVAALVAAAGAGTVAVAVHDHRHHHHATGDSSLRGAGAGALRQHSVNAATLAPSRGADAQTASPPVPGRQSRTGRYAARHHGVRVPTAPSAGGDQTPAFVPASQATPGQGGGDHHANGTPGARGRGPSATHQRGGDHAKPGSRSAHAGHGRSNRSDRPTSPNAGNHTSHTNGAGGNRPTSSGPGHSGTNRNLPGQAETTKPAVPGQVTPTTAAVGNLTHTPPGQTHATG